MELKFPGKMSVLDNGGPTKEFAVEKGLRQGDPLSLFLFVIVAEALKGLVSKAVENGDYVGFTERDVGGSLDYQGYLKSFRNGVRREENHFTFLGIPIGINPRCPFKSCEGDYEVAKWRILGGSETLWYKVLKARYGDINLHVISYGGNSKGASNSLWWKDIMSLEKVYKVDVFANNCSFNIVCSGRGDGWLDDGFWEWGDFGVAEASILADVLVAVQHLRSFVGSVQPVTVGTDAVGWAAKADRRFSVKSCYSIFNTFHVPFGPDMEFYNSFGCIWKLEVPQNIKAFGWRCFLNRLPTKDLLLRRGISFANSFACVCCGLERESLNHLLLDCGVSALIWKEIAIWLGYVDFYYEGCIMGSFMKWYGFCKSNKVKSGKEGTIWLSIC
ncbi:uncharacterized protein LOC131637526 [Vicia villosa]|uniref:uncharacterized protein LOC131637526 n=1 Tax=Vicia villosa TaxID=3911 RepID=UPI00273B4C77|nr:uncharacterized protein LOC131637526 [Vicia villosa]